MQNFLGTMTKIKKQKKNAIVPANTKIIVPCKDNAYKSQLYTKRLWSQKLNQKLKQKSIMGLQKMSSKPDLTNI